MTISNVTEKTQYTSTGQTTFAYTFKILADADILVVTTNLTTGVDTTHNLTTDYTVTGAGNDSGGNVVFNTATTSGHRVTLTRSMALTQTTDLVTQGGFSADVLETSLDRLTMFAQQLTYSIKKGLETPTSDTSTIDDLPTQTARADKFLAFDSSGNPIAAASVTGSAASTWGTAFIQKTTGQAAADVITNTDGFTFKFGADADVLLSHSADQGLILKNANTSDDKPATLYLQTGETDIAVNDYLGRIFFQAPDESTGTDAVAIAAEVSAISEGDFSASNNATSLSFGTGSSGASVQKMKLSSTGVLTLNGPSGSIIIPDGGNIGSASDTDAMAIASTGVVTFTKQPVLPETSRNFIDNGNMEVAQRGTSVSFAAGDYKVGAIDRWWAWSGSAVEFDIKTSSVVPTGFGNSLHIDITTADGSLAATDAFYLNQQIEGLNVQSISKGTAGAKKLTVSFWVRSPKTGVHIIELLDRTNSRQCSQSYTIASANTYEKHSVTFPADTTGSLSNTNVRALSLLFWLAAGSNYQDGSALGTTWHTNTNTRAKGQVNVGDDLANNFYVTGVKMETGETATPFVSESYQDNLAKCQRYYQTLAANSTTYLPTLSSYPRFFVNFPVTMRAAPTVTLPSTFVGAATVDNCTGYYNSTSVAATYPSVIATAEMS